MDGAHERIFRIGSQAFWAILDQGLFAGANFVTNILLARWLTASQYGAFVLSFSSFLIIGIIHTSLITEPMLVLGSSLFRTSFKSYFKTLCLLHWKLTCGLSLVLIVPALLTRLTNSFELSWAFWGLIPSAPLILSLWLSRRAFYVIKSPKLSAFGGIAYLMCLLISMWLIHKTILLNPSIAFIVMGLISYSIYLYFMRELQSISISDTTISQSNIILNHRKYGGWILSSALITWIPNNALYFFLSSWGNLENSAAFRALINLQMPVLNINTALGVILLPNLARIAQTHDIVKLGRVVKIAIVLFLLIAFFIVVGLAISHRSLFTFFYAGKYSESEFLGPILGVFVLFSTISTVIGNALRSLQATRMIFNVAVVTAVVSLTAGILMIPHYGVKGAVMTMIISSFVEASVLAVIYIRVIRDDFTRFDQEF